MDGEGNDSRGAGAVRFDTKAQGGPAGEGGERVYNYVRLVRGGDVAETPDGDPSQGPPDFAAAAETMGITEAELMAALGIAKGGMPPGGKP